MTATVVGGTIVGLMAPGVGKGVGVLGTMFVRLIKMMITPVIFCAIVLGIGSVPQSRHRRQGRGPGVRLLPVSAVIRRDQ